MFAKTALIATIAVAAQALTLQATAAAKNFDFGNDDFLFGGEDAFEQAMAAREKFVKEQEALNEKRGAAVKFYFNARDIAAEKVKLEIEWNAAWDAACEKHDAAIAKHEGAKADTIAKGKAKRQAMKAHLAATLKVNEAQTLKDVALANWNDSKLDLATAQGNDADAEAAHNAARIHHESMSQALAEAEAHEAAMDAEF